MIKYRYFSFVLVLMILVTSCKQQKINVLPGAVISKDGTKDGLLVNKDTDVKTVSKITFSSDLFFPNNSSYLTDAAKIKLDELVISLKKENGKKIKVYGYTDSVGTVEYNIWLSEKRAISVKNYLEQKGISGSRIETKGFGVSNPIGDNSTAEGRKKNRRVEILF